MKLTFQNRVQTHAAAPRPLWRKAALILTVSAAGFVCMGPVSAQDSPSTVPSAQNTMATPDTAQPYQPSVMSPEDVETLESALELVRTRNFAAADSMKSGLSNPVARKIVTWAIINNDGQNIYSFAALDGARRDLWGWPRETKRQIAAEKMIGLSGMTGQQVVDWFNGSPPETIEGAVALINAQQAVGNVEEASQLAKTWWRTKTFDAMAQASFQQAFGRYLTQDDTIARVNCLIINTQSGSSQAIRDLLPNVNEHTRAVANAALALRTGAAGSDALYTSALALDPRNKALAFARAKYLSGKGLEPLGYPILADLPPASMSPEAAGQLYAVRLAYFKSALKAKDYRAAYNAMKGGGFEAGESKAEAEFFAGWMALLKLNDTNAAVEHFHNLATAGTSPITQGRANYWLGRAYEKRDNPGLNGINPDSTEAQKYYAKGGQYVYAFYGQLAAEKAGIKTISIGKDPIPTAADRQRFESRDTIRAARILASIGQIDMFRQIVLATSLVLPNAEEEALLVDLTARYDTQFIAMKVARNSMQRGFYLPERAYPLRAIPDVPSPEKAFVLAITRQESGFDPKVRSHANARGMMQLIPSTAKAVARRLGQSYNDSRLYEPEFNMSLGAYHLGELVTRFDGSYIMAAAAYNAGPSRMSRWVNDCGDPRGPNADPLSFIECHPFNETRNYMMRVTENVHVYRARLGGGSAALTPWSDVQRGLPAPIINMSDDGETGTIGGDGDGAMSYLDYQKAEAQNAALAASLAQAAAAEPVRPKATAKSKMSAKAKKAKTKKASTKKTRKKKRDD
jgi:soluble lytic murein transglycosylase